MHPERRGLAAPREERQRRDPAEGEAFKALRRLLREAVVPDPRPTFWEDIEALIGTAGSGGPRGAPPTSVLTDFSYLIQAALPGAAERLTGVFRWHYRRLAPRYEERAVGPGYDDALRLALARCDLSPYWCADIAAGTGAAARLLRLRFPGARIVAVDLSLTMLAQASSDGMFRVGGDAWALPLPNALLDLAVVQNAPPGLSELARVVRPGGVVIFSLSSVRAVPGELRRWLLSRGLPPELHLQREAIAGAGVAWLLRRRG